MCLDFKWSCCRFVDGAIVKEPHESVALSDVILIDAVNLTKNDRRIRFRTVNGDYICNLNGPLSVFEDMLTEHGFWRSDTKNLVNMQHVDKIQSSMFAAEVVFKGTELRGEMASSKIKLLQKLFPAVPVVRGGLF